SATGGARTHPAALVWVDRRGRSESVTEIRRNFVALRLSPDRKRIAVSLDQATAEVWVYDLERATFARLAYGWDNNMPLWTPDGTRVTFNSTTGASGVFWKAADGTGVAEPLTTTHPLSAPQSWSPDGRFLVFQDRKSVV